MQNARCKRLVWRYFWFIYVYSIWCFLACNWLCFYDDWCWDDGKVWQHVLASWLHTWAGCGFDRNNYCCLYCRSGMFVRPLLLGPLLFIGWGGGWCKSKYTMVILFQFTPHPGSEIDFLIRPPNGRRQVANLGGQKFGNCEEQENVMWESLCPCPMIIIWKYILHPWRTAGLFALHNAMHLGAIAQWISRLLHALRDSTSPRPKMYWTLKEICKKETGF